MNVTIIENNPFFRAHLARALLTRWPAAGVSEHDGGKSAIDHCEHAPRPDLVLVSLDLPDIDAQVLIRDLRQRCPQVPILATSINANDPLLLQAVQAGASGYLIKAGSNEEICTSIACTMRGEYLLCPNMARMILALPTPHAGEGGEALTPREVVTLQALGESKSQADISAMMKMSHEAIQAIIRRIYEKIRTRNPDGLHKRDPRLSAV